MLLPIVGSLGPVIALGTSIVYCGKGRDQAVAKPTAPPGKKPINPKSAKESAKKGRSQKSTRSKGSAARSSKSCSTKPISKKAGKSERGKKSTKGSKRSLKGKKDASTKSKSKSDKKKEKSVAESKKDDVKDKKSAVHNEQKVETPLKFSDLKEKFGSTALGPPQTVDLKMLPAELCWKPNGGIHQVHIVNNSKERRAIKAKCTDNLIYRVHPVHGFLNPGESFKVDVLRNNAASKSDVLVFLTTRAQEGKEAKECFADKDQPTEMLVLPLLPEKVES